MSIGLAIDDANFAKRSLLKGINELGSEGKNVVTRAQTYVCVVAVLIAVPSSNQSCSSFDGLTYKLKAPACSMPVIEARLRKNPGDVSALLDRAQAYLTAGECELAVQDYTAAIKHNPRLGTAYLGRSRALEMIGSHPQALLDIDQAIKLCDKTWMADALLHKTAVLKALDRGAECPPLYEKLIGSKGLGVGPSDTINLREQRAALYLRLKKPELALLDLEVCGTARPGSLDIFLNKGKAYALLSNSEKELEAYSRGIKLDNITRSLNGDRLMADLYQARAKLYKKMGKLSLAEADLKKSRLNQKILYKEIYEPDEAVDIFQKAK